MIKNRMTFSYVSSSKIIYDLIKWFLRQFAAKIEQMWPILKLFCNICYFIRNFQQLNYYYNVLVKASRLHTVMNFIASSQSNGLMKWPPVPEIHCKHQFGSLFTSISCLCLSKSTKWRFEEKNYFPQI